MKVQVDAQDTGDALILKASKRSEMSFLVLMEPTRRRREEVDGLREIDGEGVADVDTEVVIINTAPSLARHWHWHWQLLRPPQPFLYISSVMMEQDMMRCTLPCE